MGFNSGFKVLIQQKPMFVVNITLKQSSLSRVPQNIVRGSQLPDKNSRDISREYFSGNWQYLNNLYGKWTKQMFPFFLTMFADFMCIAVI
jgi:hypothetical protein